MFSYCREASNKNVQVVILEGILALHFEELRQLMDIKIFVNADTDERIVRRIRRNVEKGMKLQDICDYYLETVRFQHKKYVEPTCQYANLVIEGGMMHVDSCQEILEMLCAAIKKASVYS